MKNIGNLLLILVFILSSCENKNAFTITGSYNDKAFDGETVYLQRLDSLKASMPSIIDSTVILEGKFKFEGLIKDAPCIAFISIGHIDNPVSNTPIGTFVLEPGNINIEFDKSGIILSGTKTNDDFNKVHALGRKISALQQEVMEVGGIDALSNDSLGQNANERLQKLQDELVDKNFGFLKLNINNKVGEFLFFNTVSILSKEQIKEILSLANSEFLNKPEVKIIKTELERVIPEAGQPVVDVMLLDKNGNQVGLTNYIGKGKYVLIDFWASWCGPCIKEIPTMKSIYSKYKAKGFEIVGISIDEDENEWMEALKSHDMPWIQLADASGAAAQIYGVTAIPYTILVDKEGKIIAKGIRGEALDNKLKELFK